MIDIDREVGGIRCFEVLDLLPDFVDDALDSTRLEQVRLHLEGCDTCEKFGGEYSALVRVLRAHVAARSDSGVRARLGRTLASVQDQEVRER